MSERPFDVAKTFRLGQKIARARLRVEREEARLRAALAFCTGVSESQHVGDPDCLDYSSVTRPLLVAVYDRRWQIKVGSIVLEHGNRVQIWTTNAVPLLDCPTRLLVRFGLGEELSVLVDHVICSELAASARPGGLCQ